MSSKMPPIPKEQRSFRQDPNDHPADADARQSGRADMNTSSQGRFGNIRQNLTPQRSVQDR